MEETNNQMSPTAKAALYGAAGLGFAGLLIGAPAGGLGAGVGLGIALGIVGAVLGAGVGALRSAAKR